MADLRWRHAPVRSRLATGLLFVSLGLTIGLVAASLGVLWRTATQVLDQERVRAEAPRALEQAADALGERARPFWSELPPWPQTMSALEWDAFDDFLAAEAGPALSPFRDVQGGFFLTGHDRYLARCPRPDGLASDAALPPASIRDEVDDQVRRTLADSQPHFSVTDTSGTVSAVRTALAVDGSGRIASVIWTTKRLGGTLFADREAAAGYRTAAVLAIGGVAVALLLTAALVAAARRHGRECRRLEAELRRSERLAAMGKLLAGVAHEVRNPLAGIRSSAQLWLRGLGPDAESIGRVVDEVDRIEGLIAQLLRFSRSQGPKLVADDLNAVVAEATELVRLQADPRGVQIVSDLADDLPEIPLERAAFLQVLRNLTTNALQAMPDGGRVRLVTRTHPSRKWVEVTVADSGPGLSETARAHLFEPFFTTRPDGTGLGLPIAREIVLAHGGEILVDDAHSPSGHGSSPRFATGCAFTIRLPTNLSKPVESAPTRLY